MIPIPRRLLLEQCRAIHADDAAAAARFNLKILYRKAPAPAAAPSA